MTFSFMVSIIIPVYNAEKYLQEAIDSVLAQSWKDWELILVDDGSTDSSGRICERGARMTSKIKVIHQSNKGLCGARNTGLRYAKGDYLTFLDADDVLPYAALSLMMDCATKFNADIVCGDIKEFYDDLSPLLVKSMTRDLFSSHYRLSLLTPAKAVKKMLYQRGIDNSASGKLYNADLWKTLRFHEGIGYEDLDLIPRLFMQARKIAKVHKTVYLYRQHTESYIHTFSLRRADVLDVTSRLTDFFTSYHPSLAPAARARQLNANFNILGLIAANSSCSSTSESNSNNNDNIKAMLLSDQCWDKIKELRGEALRNPSVRWKTKIGVISSYLGGRKFIELLSRKIYRQ